MPVTAAGQRKAHSAPCVATTWPLAFRIRATTSGPERAWTNVAAILVAPAWMSFRLLSKSNSASPATALCNGDVAVPPAAVTRARKLPPRGTSPRPSTEIFERLARRSQRSRMDAIAGVTGEAGCRSVAASDGADGDDDRVIRTGSCSGSADWKLKVKTDDGKLEVEGEVDSNTAGQTWAWKLKHDGTVVAKGSSTTTGRSGSFDVERKIANKAGTDRVVFKASYNGQKCSGVVNFG